MQVYQIKKKKQQQQTEKSNYSHVHKRYWPPERNFPKAVWIQIRLKVKAICLLLLVYSQTAMSLTIHEQGVLFY